jgi:hypothetical protein
MDNIPEFIGLEWFDSSGQGKVVTVRLDRTRDEKGLVELSQSEVLVDGVRYRCRGVERFAHCAPWHEGELVGLYITPVQHLNRGGDA